jgi:hypothetical protein
MPSIPITLKKVGHFQWRLFSPKGHALSEVFRGEQHKALEWARAWVSCWYNWIVVLDNGDERNDEKKD